MTQVTFSVDEVATSTKLNQGIQGFKLIDKQVFTSSGTWTRPTGAVAAHVRVVGGGGGGGGVDGAASTAAAGGGGGAGAYAEEFITSGLGGTETVTVGAGGAGGNFGDGANGGTSSFGSHLSCDAGGGGQFMTGGNGATSVNGGAGAATPTTGDVNVGGQAGHGGIRFTATAMMRGFGGSGPLGAGGRSSQVAGTGNNGTGYGAGGSGAGSLSASDLAGGNGSAGVVIVEAYA